MLTLYIYCYTIMNIEYCKKTFNFVLIKATLSKYYYVKNVEEFDKLDMNYYNYENLPWGCKNKIIYNIWLRCWYTEEEIKDFIIEELRKKLIEREERRVITEKIDKISFVKNILFDDKIRIFWFIKRSKNQNKMEIVEKLKEYVSGIIDDENKIEEIDNLDDKYSFCLELEKKYTVSFN